MLNQLLGLHRKLSSLTTLFILHLGVLSLKHRTQLLLIKHHLRHKITFRAFLQRGLIRRNLGLRQLQATLDSGDLLLLLQ